MPKKIDIGVDKNLLSDNLNNPRRLMVSSQLIDELPKTPEDTLFEAKKAVWDYWLNVYEPLLTGYADEDGTAYLFFLSNQLKNRVIHLEITCYSFMPCRRALAYAREWHHRYNPAGLMTIVVHTPIFEFERDRKFIEAMSRQLNITFPVVMDNDYSIWKSLENRFWPRRVLFSPNGEVVQDFQGEGGYEEFEKTIQRLLRQLSPGLSCPPLLKPIHSSDKADYKELNTTHEIFFGHERNMIIGNKEKPTEDYPAVIFTDARLGPYNPGVIYFEGLWYVSKESVYGVTQTLGSKPVGYYGDMRLTVQFEGTDAYLVACTKTKTPGDIAQSVKVEVLIDGSPLPESCYGADVGAVEAWPGLLIVRASKLYHIATSLPHKQHTLTLSIDNEGTDTLDVFGIFFDSVESET